MYKVTVNGIATTTKYRFKEKHNDFEVFSVYRNTKDRNPLLNKKKDDGLDDDLDNTIQ